MNKQSLRGFLFLAIGLAGMSAACSNTVPTPPVSMIVNPTPSSTSTPPKLLPTNATGAATSTRWTTWTAPHEQYSIQYPIDLGQLTANQSTDAYGRATSDETLIWESSDFYVMISPYTSTEEQYYLEHTTIVPQGTLSISGMTGELYTTPGGSGRDERAFLSSPPGTPAMIYFLSFEGGLSQEDLLPPFWHEMLNSFHTPR